ncbi:MAG: hypothetical protein ACE5IK_05245 [Acidobacteriota bacterium]
MALATLLLLPSPAAASRVQARDLRQMVAAAGTIFAGVVTAVEPDRVRGLPATRVTFLVEEGLRGAPADHIELLFPGGVQSNGFPYRISGLSRFSPGDRVVLLTYPASRLGLTSPVGLYQGRFDIRPGPGGVSMVVAGGPRPANLVDPDSPAARRAAMTPARLSAATPGNGPAGPVASPPSRATARSFVYGDFMDELRRLVHEQ